MLFFYQLINSALRLSPQKLFYIDITFYFCLPLVTFILLYRTDKALFYDFLKQLKPPPCSRVSSVVLTAIVLGIILAIFFGYVESQFRKLPVHALLNYKNISDWDFLIVVTYVLYSAITAALIEEIFYKPVFFYLTVNQVWITQKQAIIASVALFTLVHI